jgi:diguanylate cyclase (GGDEF)-like protein
MPWRLMGPNAAEQSADASRAQMPLLAALDAVPIGIVLLDIEMRARFINRAFRRMWRLPDAKADAQPAFIALMHHGCDTLAYAVPPQNITEYVNDRLARVRAGNSRPYDIRLKNGEVIRFECTALPNGGRMLSYHYVTDIVRQSDDLRILRAALDKVEAGVILLDENMIVQYTNEAMRRLWQLSEEKAQSHPTFAELVNTSRTLKSYAVSPENLDQYIAGRIAHIRSGDPTPVDISLSDGRVIRSTCTILTGGGRMITYNDVTDLVRIAETERNIAAVDELTGVPNRRQFKTLGNAEWSRFQRYQRPLSVLSFDIDYFKTINDRFGHDTGDAAIRHVVEICVETKRTSDTLARIGGDEFTLLLPETDLPQAEKLAGRLRAAVHARPLSVEGNGYPLTLSIGIAEATLSMASLDVLIKAADRALYEAKSRGRDRAVCYAETAGPWPDAAE